MTAPRRGKTFSANVLRRTSTLASGGVSILYMVFVFLPQQQKIRQQWCEVTDMRTESARIEELVQPRKAIAEELRDTRAFVVSWKHDAPRTKAASPVFGAIVYEARAANIQLVSFLPEAEQELATIGLIPIQLQARGTFHNVHEFLRRLELLPFSQWIEQLDLQAVDSSEGTVNCSIKITVFADREEKSDQAN